ncbi:hypothetical protein G6Z92_06150 [Vibrio aestuarianus subsp. cardii]|uniref:hypothetical protein n=1 Tax=Vibrio aestuarianus TaxID=28171 RepID=UPI0015C54D1C|nr:hypothetical protein [Vibrio aestuarianus]NGZ66566.1 hypothetical protein [Vibrio aestuarianus subsp. cardii]
MNTYLVKIYIQTGEYQKVTHNLIQANSFSAAIHYGIYAESHDPEKLDWSESRVVDMGGEFAYHASAEKIKQTDFEVMSKYLPVMVASLDELLTSGNYKDHCYVAPVNKPRTLWECCLAQATKYLVSMISGNAYSDYLYIKNSDCREIPHGLNMVKENKASFLINSREELLNEIEAVARVIESTLKRGFELCDTELKQQSAVVSQPMSEIFHQAILREQGLKYPDDMPFDS